MLLEKPVADVMAGSMGPVIIFALGNYVFPSTKHSLGHILLDSLLKKYTKHHTMVFDKSINAWTCRAAIPSLARNEDAQEEHEMLLVKSKHLMNHSGRTLLPLIRREYLSSKGGSLPNCLPRLVVLQDDIGIPSGRHRSQFSGSPAGHNGIKSVIAELRTSKFHRFKLGIGHPADTDKATWCLSPSTRAEVDACAEEGKATQAAWEYINRVAAGQVPLASGKQL